MGGLLLRQGLDQVGLRPLGRTPPARAAATGAALRLLPGGKGGSHLIFLLLFGLALITLDVVIRRPAFNKHSCGTVSLDQLACLDQRPVHMIH